MTAFTEIVLRQYKIDELYEEKTCDVLKFMAQRGLVGWYQHFAGI
jgi:hypothetical protein